MDFPLITVLILLATIEYGAFACSMAMLKPTQLVSQRDGLRKRADLASIFYGLALVLFIVAKIIGVLLGTYGGFEYIFFECLICVVILIAVLACYVAIKYVITLKLLELAA